VNEQAAVLATPYLTFYLGGEECAAGILRIREIVHYDTALTRIPATPAWIRGAMNLHGTVVPVVDLAVKFGLPATAITKRTCVLMVEVELQGERTAIGIVVDAVSRAVDLDAIEPAPPGESRVPGEFLLGVGRLGKQSLPILDLDRLLSLDELLRLTATTAGEPS